MVRNATEPKRKGYTICVPDEKGGFSFYFFFVFFLFLMLFMRMCVCVRFIFESLLIFGSYKSVESGINIYFRFACETPLHWKETIWISFQMTVDEKWFCFAFHYYNWLSFTILWTLLKWIEGSCSAAGCCEFDNNMKAMNLSIKVVSLEKENNGSHSNPTITHQLFVTKVYLLILELKATSLGFLGSYYCWVGKWVFPKMTLSCLINCLFWFCCCSFC